MSEITDEFMKEMLTKTKQYFIVILKDGPNCCKEDAKKIVWEHGRRNFAQRRDGIMPIVCPISGESDVSGVAIFNVPLDKTRERLWMKIQESKPASSFMRFIPAGVFQATACLDSINRQFYFLRIQQILEQCFRAPL